MSALLAPMERARRARMETYSFTKMNTADQCLLAYAGKYGNGERFRKMPFVVSPALERGRVLHGFIERYVAYLQERQLEQDIAVVGPLVETAFREDRETLSTDVWNEVWRAAHGFAWWYKHNFETYVGAEFKLERVLRMNDGSDVLVIAYPDHAYLARDHVGELVVFRDWKTSWDAKVTDANVFQGEITSWCAQGEAFANQRTAYEVAFPRPQIVSDRVVLEDRDVARVQARMRAIVDRIRQARADNRFPARPGHACAFCPIAPRCATHISYREAGIVIADTGAAERALAETVVLEAALKQREKALKAYVSIEGVPVRANGFRALFRTVAGSPKIRSVLDLFSAFDAIRPPAALLDLLSVNGNKTKAKKVQNDPRLAECWTADAKVEYVVEADKGDAIPTEEPAAEPEAVSA